MSRRARKTRNRLPFIIGGGIAFLALLILLLVIGPLRGRHIPSVFESYPVAYEDEVAAAAEEFELEPAYLYAVILAESSFRPDAVSSTGALGLMQIMPETGEWIANKLDIADFTPEMLTEPAINTRLGAWYLNYLLRRYDGHKFTASAAYHAGQGTVDKWLKDPALSEDGKTLTDAGYDSTKYYANRVVRNYEAYLTRVPQDP